MTVCFTMTSEGGKSSEYLVCSKRRLSACQNDLFRILSGQDEMTVCNDVTSESSD
jgi:hypothetical protein